MEQERTLSRSVANAQLSTLASSELARQRERNLPSIRMCSLQRRASREVLARDLAAVAAEVADRIACATPALLYFCNGQFVRLVDEVLDRADQAIDVAHGQALRGLNVRQPDELAFLGATPVDDPGGVRVSETSHRHRPGAPDDRATPTRETP